MAFIPKSWKNKPSTATPVSAAALIDLEERTTKYSEEVPIKEAQLPSSVVSSSGAAAGLVPIANGLNGYAWGLGGETFTGDATGATDCGPALQEAFDAGHTVTLKHNGTYLIETPIFLDSTSLEAKYVLNMNGAELKAGPGLPSASGLSGLGEAAVKWIFFNNTKRAALSGGVVTTSEANRATTGLAQAPRLLIRDGYFNANGQIIGIAFGNGAASRLQNVTMANIQAGISWVGYVDQNTAEAVQFAGASPSGGQGSRLIYQREAGDGTSVVNTKCYGGVHLDLAGCEGFRAASPVSGQFLLNNCIGIIEAGHEETDEITTSPYSVFLNRTQLTYISSTTFASKKSTACTIQIEDEGGNLATTLDLIDHRETYFYRVSPEDAADPTRGPTVNIVAINTLGHVRSWGSKTVIQDGWSGTAERYAEGFYITSSIAGITTALAAGADQIATGYFDLAYNGTWLVSAPAGAPLAPKNLTAPSFTAAADASGIKGALVEGQTYEYIAAAKSADGRYTPLSAEETATPGVTLTNKLVFANPATPCRIAIWRYKGTGSVKTAPDHYIEIPMDGYGGTWYDTGTHINGRTWVTASIPEPNAVKGAGTVTNTTEPAGAIFSTFDRMALTDSALTLEAGKAQMTLVRHKGGKLTKLNFRTSSTASKGAGHAWLALVNLRGEVVAVTAERTALAINTTQEWEVTEPLNLPPGLYYAAILQNFAEAEATIIGSSGAGSTLALLPPISTGLCTTTGLTTPPELGKPLPVPTTGNAAVPYIWAT